MTGPRSCPTRRKACRPCKARPAPRAPNCPRRSATSPTFSALRSAPLLTGFDTGINNALFGGWYGGDDGYVFGLFGGEPVLGGPTPGITGSLLATLSNDFANISTNPNGSEQLFSDFNNYSLELLDHTLKPLLAPLLDETTKGATTLSIPVELSQIQTNLLMAFADYNELKGVSETLLSPEISGVFALTSDLDSHQRRVQRPATAPRP